MTDFYTYQYFRDNETPYYVGKGKGRRAFSGRGRYEVHPPSNDDGSPCVARINVQYWATEQEAHDIEKWWIKFWGRKDNNTGILRNRTDGGEGSSNLSEESRRKISKAKIGRPHLHTQETRRKLSQALIGKKKSAEACRRMSEAKRKHYEETSLQRDKDYSPQRRNSYHASQA